MNEVVNLLKEESSFMVKEISVLDTHLQDVLDVLTLLRNSCSNDTNKSMHNMLDIVIKNLDNVRDIEVSDFAARLDKFYISLCSIPEKPKRTRTPKSDTGKDAKKTVNRKPRTPKPKIEVKEEKVIETPVEETSK